ncbi:MAG: hypothetical protein WC332_00535 [Clostridia bacterium]|jgi:hypothetical protein
MGFVGDILLPAAAGAGRGFSQGIQDYGNIQKIRREEEEAPVHAELNRLTLSQAQRQEKEAALRDAELNKLWNPYDEPLYKASTPEGQAFIQSAFPEGKQYTVRDKMSFAQQIPANQQIFKHVTDAATNIMAGKKTEAVNNYNTILEKIASTPTTDPNYKTLVDGLTTAKANMENVSDQYDKATNNFKKGESQVAINQLYINNRGLIDSSPALKMMTDLTRQTGDVQGMEKIIDIIAKAKDPQINNEFQLFLQSEIKRGNKDLSDISSKWQKRQVQVAGAKASATASARETVKGSQAPKLKATFSNSKGEIIRALTDGTYEKQTVGGWAEANPEDLAGLKTVSNKAPRIGKKLTFNPQTGEIE